MGILQRTVKSMIFFYGQSINGMLQSTPAFSILILYAEQWFFEAVVIVKAFMPFVVAKRTPAISIWSDIIKL